MCHKAPGNSTSGKCVINILRFDSGTPEEWIFIIDLVQKVLVGQNITTGLPMYKCMEKVLKGDFKGEFTQQANLVGSLIVDNFTTVLAKMTMHITGLSRPGTGYVQVLKEIQDHESKYFHYQANSVGSHIVSKFNVVMAKRIVHIFPVLIYQDQK